MAYAANTYFAETAFLVNVGAGATARAGEAVTMLLSASDGIW